MPICARPSPPRVASSISSKIPSPCLLWCSCRSASALAFNCAQTSRSARLSSSAVMPLSIITFNCFTLVILLCPCRMTPLRCISCASCRHRSASARSLASVPSRRPPAFARSLASCRSFSARMGPIAADVPSCHARRRATGSARSSALRSSIALWHALSLASWYASQSSSVILSIGVAFARSGPHPLSCPRTCSSYDTATPRWSLTRCS